ncbi:MAG: PD-(D/E)XK nuclease family protein, partial [Planctomycetota bacterium]
MKTRAILGEFPALEERLWTEIERRRADDPLTPLAVVAPTGLLVRRLKIEAARRFENGLFNVRFANLFQFAFDLAGAMRAAILDLKDAAVAPEPGTLIERLKGAVDEQATGEFDNRLTAYGIAKFGDLLAAYVHHEKEIERLGAADLPDVFRRAAEHADRADRTVLVYGFYDLTQIQADLLEAVAAATECVFFVPAGDPETWKFGDWYRSEFVKKVSEGTERVEGGAPPGPEVRNAAGERDEIHDCARRIRRLLDDGVPAEEIALVARSLEPYLPHVEDLFREHRIPVAALPGRPLREHPLAKAARILFRLPLEDFPRAAVLDVLLHPLFKAEGERRHWDYLARSLRIGRGRDWGRLKRKKYVFRSGRDDDRRELVVSAAEAQALRKAVKGLRDAPRPKTAGWKGHADAHFRKLGLFDRGEMTAGEREVLEQLSAIVGGLGGLEVLGEKVPLAEFLEAFDRELDRATLRRPPSNGVAVLDAMAVRGLSFAHVFLVGLNAHTFPRFIVEEPFISDPVRRHVLRVLGHHLPVRRDGYDEERLLFHVVRTAARERFVCLYQRADAAGRQKDPSPLLRPFLGDRDAIPAVPRGFRAKLAEEALLTPSERILFSADPGKWLTVFGRDTAAFRRAREFFAALSSGKAGPFEGIVGKTRDFRKLSPTRLERYAGCPFQFFASDVLRIFPYEEGVEGDDLTPMEVGSLEHLMLEKLYRDPDGGIEAAAREFEEQYGIALAGLLAARRDLAAKFVRKFAEWDRAHPGGWTPVDFEKWGKSEFAGVEFTGKMDRIDRDAGGALRVVDYKKKSGGGWKTRLATQAKRAEKLQGPLYLEFSGAREAVFSFVEDHTTRDPARAELSCALTRDEWAAVRSDVERA